MCSPVETKKMSVHLSQKYNKNYFSIWRNIKNKFTLKCRSTIFLSWPKQIIDFSILRKNQIHFEIFCLSFFSSKIFDIFRFSKIVLFFRNFKNIDIFCLRFVSNIFNIFRFTKCSIFFRFSKISRFSAKKNIYIYENQLCVIKIL